jgi:hypothetical protein
MDGNLSSTRGFIPNHIGQKAAVYAGLKLKLLIQTVFRSNNKCMCGRDEDSLAHDGLMIR